MVFFWEKITIHHVFWTYRNHRPVANIRRFIDNVQTPHPSSSRLRNRHKCFLKVRPKSISTKKRSFSTSSQNHHIMALKNGEYFLFAFDLEHRAIGTKPIPHHPNHQVYVQPPGTQAHKVSDDVLMFPNAYWGSAIGTVAPRTYWWLEICSHIRCPRSSTSAGCEWRCTSGLWDTSSPYQVHVGDPRSNSCTTSSWTIIFVSSWPCRLSHLILWRYYRRISVANANEKLWFIDRPEDPFAEVSVSLSLFRGTISHYYVWG